MDYRALGSTKIKVSILCLGTQTWGEQNTESEAHSQMDMAIDLGMNFVDTAEMYPFPAKSETSGNTEMIIGKWLKRRKCREKIILSTKVTSRSNLNWIDEKGTRLTKSRVRSAVEGSLKRLNTDYIDLYQLHWPDRYTNIFGRLGYNPDPDDDFIPLEDQLEVLDELVRDGKIRYIGVSNETPWGLMTFLKISEIRGWPRMTSIQNPYSLLNRSLEVGLAEVVIREHCSLLAYSPLAFGLLTGKYINDLNSSNGRLTIFKNASKRYINQKCIKEAKAYVEIAIKNGLDPAQMALAFNNSRPFITSTIIGATNLDQLATNIASIELTLPENVLKMIETAHENNPFPCP